MFYVCIGSLNKCIKLLVTYLLNNVVMAPSRVECHSTNYISPIWTGLKVHYWLSAVVPRESLHFLIPAGGASFANSTPNS